MAVQAPHLHPQSLTNRMMTNTFEGLGSVYGTPFGYGVLTTSPIENVTPVYGSSLTEAVMEKTAAAVKCDSGLTYAVPVSRKRSRDAINPLFQNGVHNPNTRCGSVTFLGEDLSIHFQQQQLEVDRFVAQHTEKVRTEIEERRKRHARRIAEALEENVMKKLRSKEAEIEKMGKLNYALEERVKNLCDENQIWRNVAQTNEATANALRCNLEQILSQVQDEQGGGGALLDDTESCCGSNSGTIERMCKSCGKEESCVLLLPCRHLCLCTLCGSSLHTCPLCNCIKTASVHVNFE